MKNTRVIIFTVVATLFLIFLLQNTQIVSIPIFFWKMQMSRIMLMIILLIIGFFAGVVAMQIFNKRRNRS